MVHPLITPLSSVLQVIQIVLPLNAVAPRRVEQLHSLFRIHPIYVDQIPADQIACTVQTMGAVDSNQLVVFSIVPQEVVHSTFKAQDCLVIWYFVPLCVDLQKHQRFRYILYFIVAGSESQVNN